MQLFYLTLSVSDLVVSGSGSGKPFVVSWVDAVCCPVPI